ncbi:hypothetical protein D0Y65_037777 [Glycine soja]|uniref:Uncharacterized protein n=1 Tax=Glycine soja TaxID=3848 RepID=A0A445H1T7_GLYSO|nr:hypothetical protein D0Y65_037777 [Glycine soja]RZB67581.1 hypothetical protein D0Y65_037777 [Glycine soja]RZB67582.1 hypothetical protein D0Y65_037777 [Glycine soja]
MRKNTKQLRTRKRMRMRIRMMMMTTIIMSIKKWKKKVKKKIVLNTRGVKLIIVEPAKGRMQQVPLPPMIGGLLLEDYEFDHKCIFG